MSVEQVRSTQSQQANGSAQTGSDSGATIYAAQQFERLMQSESDHQAADSNLQQQLDMIQKLASSSTPMQSNSGEIKQSIQSTLSGLISDGTLDVARLANVGDGSGLKLLSRELAIDPTDGKVHVLSVNADGTTSYQPLDMVSAERLPDIAARFVDLLRPSAGVDADMVAYPSTAESNPLPVTDTPDDMATARAIADANPAIKEVATEMALSPQTEALESTLGTLDGPLDTRALNAQQMRSVVNTLRDSGHLDLTTLPDASGGSGLKMINAELAADPDTGALYRFDASGNAPAVAVGQLPNERVRGTGSELLKLAQDATGRSAGDTAYSADSTRNIQTEAEPVVANADSNDDTATTQGQPIQHASTTTVDGSADLASAETDADAATGSEADAPTVDARASEELARLDALIAAWSPENDNSGQILNQIETVARDLVVRGHGQEVGRSLANMGGGDGSADSSPGHISVNEKLRYDIASDQLQVELPDREGVLEWQSLANLRGDADAIVSLGSSLSAQQDIALDPSRVATGDYAAKLNAQLNAPADIPDYLQGYSPEQLKSQAQAETVEWLTRNEQKELGRGDLKSLSRSASRAAWAELGLPVKEDGQPLYEINRWINATSVDDLSGFGATRTEEFGEHSSYMRYDDSGADGARHQWLGLTREQRLEHFGLDAASWDRAQPYIQTADSAWQMQKAMKTNYGMMVVMAVGTFVTAGALTAAMPAMAATIGTAGVNAVSSTLVSGVVTGDWEGAVKAGVTSYVGGAAGDFASGATSSQVGQFAIEAGVNGGLAELNGGDFMDGVAATATDYVPEWSASLSQSMNIQSGTWQQVAFDAVASGVTAEFSGGDFEDGFRTGAARGVQGLSNGVLAEQLEIDNPYLSTIIDAGLNGVSAELSGGDFEDGLRYTALQQLPSINAELHDQFDAEPDSMLSALLNAGTNGVGYELSGGKFADGFWNSTADSLSRYVDNMDLPDNAAARTLIEAGAAGVAGEMRGGEFGDSFLRVIGTRTGETLAARQGETAGVMTESFMHRLIDNGGDVGDALMYAGRVGLAAHHNANAETMSGGYGATPGINPSETSPWAYSGNTGQIAADDSDYDAGIYDPANDFGNGTDAGVTDPAAGQANTSGTWDSVYNPAFDFGVPSGTPADTDVPRYALDNSGNMIDLDTLEMAPAMASNTTAALGGDNGSIKPLASYTSTMQAIYNSDLTMSEKFDMMVENTSFYLAASSDALQTRLDGAEQSDQDFYLNGDGNDSALNRAAAVFNRAGHNLLQGGADAYSVFVDPAFRSEAGAALYQMVSDPSSTASGIGNALSAYGDLPWDQQIEVAGEFAVTALVSSGTALPKSMARSVDAMGEAGNATQASLRARLTNQPVETADSVYVPVAQTPGTTLYANIPVRALDGEVISIGRLSQERISQLDTETYLDPLTGNRVSFEAGDRISIDHTVPVAEIVKLDGFDRLTKEQMQNLIQDVDGEFGNLQAMPLSMNSSKRNRMGSDWSEYRGQALDAGYQEWLKRSQTDILSDMREKIQIYIAQNNAGG